MRKSWFLFLLVLGVGGFALACSTPVFRYAIERWEADPYRLMVFTDGELTDAQKEVVEGFKKYENYGYQQPPLLVTQTDVSAVSNLSKTVWSNVASNRAAPAVALLYPREIDDAVVWVDDLTTNALNRIVMSPARLETANRLLDGEAAVWVMFLGDDPEENQRAREVLNETLRNIEADTTYNEEFLEKVASEGGEVPELKFSVLEVDRNDPREAVFKAIYSNLSTNASECTSPVILPIFGQGRAVIIMMKEFIEEEYIESVAEFLTGSCSCEIKGLNPGFDVLIPVDWIDGITEEYVFDAVLPPLTSPSAALQPDPESEAEPIVETEKSEICLFRGVLGVFLVVVLGALGVVTWLVVRKKS